MLLETRYVKEISKVKNTKIGFYRGVKLIQLLWLCITFLSKG